MIPEMVLNQAGNCVNINTILRVIGENWPNIKDSVICELADIENGTLQNWRRRETAKAENVCLLIDRINDMPEDWDGEIFEAGDCFGSSLYR